MAGWVFLTHARALRTTADETRISLLLTVVFGCLSLQETCAALSPFSTARLGGSHMPRYLGNTSSLHSLTDGDDDLQRSFVVPFRAVVDLILQVSTASRASRTSSATPPFSTTILMIRPMTLLLTPPLGALHTLPASSLLLSVTAKVSVSAFLLASPVLPTAEVAEASTIGVPAFVSRDGGSMVLIARIFGPSAEDDVEALWPTEMARMESATASSSREGSKMMFEATDMTRRVMGGLAMEEGFDD